MAATGTARDRAVPRTALVVVLFLGTVALTAFVRGLAGLDTGLRAWVLGHRSAGWTSVLTVLTTLGSALVLAPVAVVLTIVLGTRGRRQDALLVGAVTLGALVLGPSLKNVIERPRPENGHLVLVHTWAYPSGHSLTSMAVFGVLTVLAVRQLPSPGTRAAAVVTGAALVASVGFSRVYLGVHWPTDVLAGWLVGAVWLTVCLILLTGEPVTERRTRVRRSGGRTPRRRPGPRGRRWPDRRRSG